MRKQLLTSGVALLALLFCACSEATKQHETIVLSNGAFVADTKKTSLSTNSILHKYLPSVLARAKIDAATIYYGSTTIEDDSLSRQLLIGNLLDKNSLFAVEINLKTDSIKFFCLTDSKWKLAGQEKINIGLLKNIAFIDFDGDTNKEVITSTYPNMNGNSWMEIYYHPLKSDSIIYAGSFSTDYEVDRLKKQLRETYEGSCYMDNSKTLYQWQHNKLLPLRQIILAHDTPVDYGSKLTLEYYENSSNSFNGLKLRFKERYDENNKEQEKLWNNFFANTR